MIFKSIRPVASALALTAALSLAAAPAHAAKAPVRAAGQVAVETGDPGVLANHRYRRYRHYRHDRVDAGDVVAGVVVLGALAAILGAADDDGRDRDRDRYEERQPQPRYDRRDDDRRGNYDSRGIESAVDMCLAQVDRGDERAESVDEARRAPDGWYVSGTLRSGSPWQCWIDNVGRIRSVDLGDDRFSQAPAEAEGQYDDAYYARARAANRAGADGSYVYDRPAPAAEGPQPAYPGGPLPGEEGYEADWRVDGDIAADDGRYVTAQAPDFRQPGD